jgi:hypothetical protein
LLLILVLCVLLFGGLGFLVSPLFLIGVIAVLLLGGGAYTGRGRGWY